MKISRRTFLSVVASASVLGPNLVLAQGDAYPNKPVQLIVSFSPGGASDYFARLVADELSKTWKQTVVVINRPGAGGNIGAAAAARAAPDGYTLYLSSLNTHGINTHLYKNLGYDPVKDFAPISKIATVPNVLVVNPTVPVKNVTELLTWMKADSKHAFYASPGKGTGPHIASELFYAMTNTKVNHVAYKGSGAALTDVMGGQVPVAIDNLPAALPFIQAGKLRALAITSAERSPLLPSVPTMVEAGVKGYEFTSWWALFAPAGTPEPIIKKINADVVKQLNTPDVQKRMQTQGGTAVTSTPAQLASFVNSETARFGKLIKERGITAED